ncbi:hypothetical protein AVEN_55615-1 [Araneus ventricosus]|uniref:Uncharacterized protein n=1 Tax=Araneus ventricosus TaxID=182803 RepID=A0A4Y2NFW3_ARAVE|nr:hypothetical protein AVEN_55615-1 [Araneus ventricosus]
MGKQENGKKENDGRGGKEQICTTKRLVITLSAQGALHYSCDIFTMLCGIQNIVATLWRYRKISSANRAILKFRSVVSGNSPSSPAKLNCNTEDSTSTKLGNTIIKVIYV